MVVVAAAVDALSADVEDAGDDADERRFGEWLLFTLWLLLLLTVSPDDMAIVVHNPSASANRYGQ